MSIQAGAQALEKSRGGSGMLLGGIPGVEPAKVRPCAWLDFFFSLLGQVLSARNALALGLRIKRLQNNIVHLCLSALKRPRTHPIPNPILLSLPDRYQNS